MFDEVLIFCKPRLDNGVSALLYKNMGLSFIQQMAVKLERHF